MVFLEYILSPLLIHKNRRPLGSTIITDTSHLPNHGISISSSSKRYNPHAEMTPPRHLHRSYHPSIHPSTHQKTIPSAALDLGLERSRYNTITSTSTRTSTSTSTSPQYQSVHSIYSSAGSCRRSTYPVSHHRHESRERGRIRKIDVTRFSTKDRGGRRLVFDGKSGRGGD